LVSQISKKNQGLELSERNTSSNFKKEAKSLILVATVAMIIRLFILELFYVPTCSMKATILEGDYIFSTKYSYGYSKYSLPFSPNLFSGRIFAMQPSRGDVVVMRPPHDMSTRYIKRLIALPGDKVQIINDVTYINDVPIHRVEVGKFVSEEGNQYIKYKEKMSNNVSFFTYKMKPTGGAFSQNDNSNFGPYEVPDGHYFFIGDNRDQSGDSRYQLGMVPFENLIAKAQFVFFSAKESIWPVEGGYVKQSENPWKWLSSIRFNRLFTSGMYNVNYKS
jgi:signal peptidase I